MSLRVRLAVELGRRASRRRETTVVMIHWGRCGSTVVGDLLGQHPSIGWDGELLQPLLRARELDGGQAPTLDDVDPRQVFLRRSRRRPEPVHGVEVKPFHLALAGTDPLRFVDDLGRLSPGLLVIVLVRHNVLRKVVSSLVARQREEWHRPAGAAPVPARIRLDPDAVFVQRRTQSLLSLLDEIVAEHRSIADGLAGRDDVVRLGYEIDVAADPTVAARTVVDRLGLDWHEPRVAYAPTTPFPLDQVVANLDEVRDTLAGTAHEWMLDA